MRRYWETGRHCCHTTPGVAATHTHLQPLGARPPCVAASFNTLHLQQLHYGLLKQLHTARDDTHQPHQPANLDCSFTLLPRSLRTRRQLDCSPIKQLHTGG